MVIESEESFEGLMVRVVCWYVDVSMWRDFVCIFFIFWGFEVYVGI